MKLKVGGKLSLTYLTGFGIMSSMNLRNSLNKTNVSIDDFSNKVLSDKGVNTVGVFTLGSSVHFVA